MKNKIKGELVAFRLNQDEINFLNKKVNEFGITRTDLIKYCINYALIENKAKPKKIMFGKEIK